MFSLLQCINKSITILSKKKIMFWSTKGNISLISNAHAKKHLNFFPRFAGKCYISHLKNSHLPYTIRLLHKSKLRTLEDIRVVACPTVPCTRCTNVGTWGQHQYKAGYCGEWHVYLNPEMSQKISLILGGCFHLPATLVTW